MGKKKSISATDLAKLGVCEFQALHRIKGTPVCRGKEAVRAINRGNKIHEEHEAKTLVYQGDGRCYIATAMYGENSSETAHLRNWRDKYLLRTWWGRKLAGFYYKTSPLWVAVCRRFGMLHKLTAWAVDRVLVKTGYFNDHN